jgi:hypothetical protein
MESLQHQSGHGRASGEFADSAVLEAVVPDTSNVDLQDLFQGWDGEFAGAGSSIVPFIAQRPFLFLGTTAMEITYRTSVYVLIGCCR